MGRGRAKAKQTKIARELKYIDPGMDVSRLQAELGAASAASVRHNRDDARRDVSVPAGGGEAGPGES